MIRIIAITLCICLFAGFVLVGKPAKSSYMLRIKGSDTMVILMSALAESYIHHRPDARVSVTGGGTRAGVAGMLNGTCDIIAASRDVTKEELELARRNGVTPKKIVIARDAIAIVVNPGNPIESMTREDLQKVFRGQASNWRDFGAAAMPITVYSRESSSGTFRYVQAEVLNNQDFSRMARFLPSNTSIIDSVSQESAAIGYVSYGHVRESKAVKCLLIREKIAGQKIAPTMDNLKSGSYPLSRDLLLYASDNRPEARAFVDYCLSDEGQRIAEEYGCVPVGAFL
jgi:phosphate transport system substrate-binding protein